MHPTPEDERPAETPQEAHIRMQIDALETSLKKLNLLEHPREIIVICDKISKLRKDLEN